MTSKQPKTTSKTTRAPATPAAPFQEISLLDLKRYVLVIRERWISGAACALLVTVLLGYFLINKPPVFQAKSQLLLEVRADRVLDIQQVVDTSLEGYQSEALLQTHVETLRTRAFLDEVVNSLTPAEIQQIQAAYIDPDNPDAPPPSVAGIIAGNRTIARVGRNTLLLDLTFRHRDPAVAAFIANRYAGEYIEFVMSRASGSNSTAIIFLSEQAKSLRADVEQADANLQIYREENNLVSLQDSRSIMVDRLRSLNNSLTSSRIERLKVDLLLDQIHQHREAGADPLEIDQIITFGSIPTLLTRLNTLESEQAILNERYLERHPKMIENARSIEKVHDLIARQVDSAVAVIRTQLQIAIEDESLRRVELAAVEREASALDMLAIQYNVLLREVEATRQTYAQVLERLNETRLSSQLENANIRIHDEARPSGAPVEPDVRRIALLLLFLGGTLLVGVPIGLETLDNKLKSASDVETMLNQNLLGEIPSSNKTSKKDRPHVVSTEQQGPTAESFRGLYGQVHLQSDIKGSKVILITSTIPSEGKSFVASNLAWSFANNSQRVLLVDCDFRRPTQHHNFSIANKKGLLNWFESGADFGGSKDAELGIHKVSDFFSLLPTGGQSNRAPEIFGSERCHNAFSELKKEFDVIIIDSPPLAVFPDAITLSGIADETIYVTRFDKVSRSVIKSILERLDRAPSEIMGIVLNDMPHSRSASYHYSGYGYYGHKKYSSYYGKAS